MNLARRRCIAITAVFLAFAPALARAEPFHMTHSGFDLTEAHADVISDREVRAETGGARSVLVTRVMLSIESAGGGRPTIVHSLDQTRLAFDCQAATYKVLSETLYAGLDPSAPKTDKAPAISALQPVADDDMRDVLQFACTGPRSVKRPMFGFQQQGYWTAMAQVADDLERTLAKLVNAAR